MIVATAGHIDHGKTSLVRALTGIDADRLPEERRRGMTIDLGFAYMPADATTTIGFVDVPGHERFVRNMLAGVAGIDFALLIVAADDGPMPQTLEHLAILDLLGIRRGAVAITKRDRVDAARFADVETEVRLIVDETVLAGAPIFPVDAIGGEGVPALRTHLLQAARRTERRAADRPFRLAIDRAFVLKGAGLVATGTVFSGSVKVGDRLLLSPRGSEVRVRGIHAQNRESHAGTAGQRCALNVTAAGLAKEDLERGAWLVDPEAHAPATRLDVRVRALPGDGPPLRDRMPVHVHLGAADLPGRLTMLEGRNLGPGEAAHVRITLDRPTLAAYGDRFVLRDQSAQVTLGGGHVVDPDPPPRGAKSPARLALLARLDQDDHAAALAEAAADAPVRLQAFARARGLGPGQAAALGRRSGFVMLDQTGGTVVLTETDMTARSEEILAALADWHARQPEQAGAPLDRLRRALPRRTPTPLFSALVSRLAREHRLVEESGRLRLPGHRIALSPDEQKLWERLLPLLAGEGLKPPRVREAAERLGVDHTAVTALLRKATRMGLVADVAPNRFFLPETIDGLMDVARALAGEADDGRFTAQQFKDRSGIGRNVTIEVLEYLDRVGLTRRDGEARRIAGTSPPPAAPPSHTGAPDTRAPNSGTPNSGAPADEAPDATTG